MRVLLPTRLAFAGCPADGFGICGDRMVTTIGMRSRRASSHKAKPASWSSHDDSGLVTVKRRTPRAERSSTSVRSVARASGASGSTHTTLARRSGKRRAASTA